uniref:Uncharacterized protein n=1 Tax=Amphimedon queenslandica TaxID=400682 RepID=A0A1X7VNQ5_AMPQE
MSNNKVKTCAAEGCQETNVPCDFWYKCENLHCLCFDHQIEENCPVTTCKSETQDYSRRDCQGKSEDATCSNQRSTGKWYTCNEDHFFCSTHQKPDSCPIDNYPKRT